MNLCVLREQKISYREHKKHRVGLKNISQSTQKTPSYVFKKQSNSVFLGVLRERFQKYRNSITASFKFLMASRYSFFVKIV